MQSSILLRCSYMYNIQIAALSSYSNMFRHIELTYCIGLSFQIMVDSCQFTLIFVGVLPFLELRKLEIQRFQHFSPTYFDICCNSLHDFHEPQNKFECCPIPFHFAGVMSLLEPRSVIEVPRDVRNSKARKQDKFRRDLSQHKKRCKSQKGIGLVFGEVRVLCLNAANVLWKNRAIRQKVEFGNTVQFSYRMKIGVMSDQWRVSMYINLIKIILDISVTLILPNVV